MIFKRHLRQFEVRPQPQLQFIQIVPRDALHFKKAVCFSGQIHFLKLFCDLVLRFFYVSF